MTDPNVPPRKPGSGRLKLVLIMLVFLAPIIAAGLLTLSGWQPEGKGNGRPIVPQRSMAEVRVDVAGTAWAWRDSEPRLTLVALPGPDCAAHCLETLALMRNARIVLNRNADRLRLLYIGTPPTAQGADAVMPDWKVGVDAAKAFEEFRPTQPDTVAAVLVESNATALSWYPAGFDPSGLRKDLQKVIR
ncbi:MAG: hypothetical protein AAGC76_16515 [Luteibacter sp.]|uniref:hypothetical protein n=1 Tax=Luteibacter sp. TaxID=1886636 RepID=UPI002808A64E|nr:hypothetical protein [Luteibacter sp.]MDQ7997446.1 hypothetical protein [Luteibacter sp.]MDQ8048376.1 hypothetical protein [Luteibacter sp.]